VKQEENQIPIPQQDPQAQDMIPVSVSELKAHMKSKREVYDFFNLQGQMLLMSYDQCNMGK